MIENNSQNVSHPAGVQYVTFNFLLSLFTSYGGSPQKNTKNLFFNLSDLKYKPLLSTQLTLIKKIKIEKKLCYVEKFLLHIITTFPNKQPF